MTGETATGSTLPTATTTGRRGDLIAARSHVVGAHIGATTEVTPATQGAVGEMAGLMIGVALGSTGMTAVVVPVVTGGIHAPQLVAIGAKATGNRAGLTGAVASDATAGKIAGRTGGMTAGRTTAQVVAVGVGHKAGAAIGAMAVMTSGRAGTGNSAIDPVTSVSADTTTATAANEIAPTRARRRGAAERIRLGALMRVTGAQDGGSMITGHTGQTDSMIVPATGNTIIAPSRLQRPNQTTWHGRPPTRLSWT